MSEGLHAMAQPLTILRTAVAASAAPGVDGETQRRYLDISSRQMERACGLFELLRDFVTASQVKADCAPFDLGALLATVTDDQRALIRALGATLQVATPETLPTVLGDLSRARQALLNALNLAASISDRGDVVELTVSICGEHVELIIRNDRMHGKSLKSRERLILSLAEANVLSQRGEYKFAEDPFCVRVRLPIQPLEPRVAQSDPMIL
jgi:signal transduction histidine kinase